MKNENYIIFYIENQYFTQIKLYKFIFSNIVIFQA